MTLVPPVPTTREELLIAALRYANNVSGLLSEIAMEVFRLDEAEGGDQPKYERIHELLLRRWREDSGVFLFIAADNLRIELPADLRTDLDDEECTAP
jgi:hypothetical protein